MKVILSVIGAIILLVIVGLATDLGGILWSGVTNPMREEVRRDTFESSRAFNEGVIRDLANYRQQWLDAEESDRPAIESTVRHRFPNYAIEDVPSGELRNWFYTVRGY